jgi:hypothetical protein
MACVLSPQPVAAQSSNLSGIGASMPSSFGRPLSDSEMGTLRGGYLPPGSSVFMNIEHAYDSAGEAIGASLRPPVPINQTAPSQTIILTPEQAVSHIRETWDRFATRLSEVSDARGAWIVTLFRDPDN